MEYRTPSLSLLYMTDPTGARGSYTSARSSKLSSILLSSGQSESLITKPPSLLRTTPKDLASEMRLYAVAREIPRASATSSGVRGSRRVIRTSMPWPDSTDAIPDETDMMRERRIPAALGTRDIPSGERMPFALSPLMAE